METTVKNKAPRPDEEQRILDMMDTHKPKDIAAALGGRSVTFVRNVIKAHKYVENLQQKEKQQNSQLFNWKEYPYGVL